MNNKSPMNQATFLNLNVCASILSNLEKVMGLSGRNLLWGQSGCQVSHTYGLW